MPASDNRVMKDDQVRIFVSSPADVDHERGIVKDVIDRLAQDYLPYFPLRAILWEEEALTADRTFQAGLTRPSQCEIVLVILWTRLGSPLPEDPYRGMTGTEWEFIDAVTNSNARGLPEVLVYKKITPKLVDITDAELAQEAIADRRRLEEFFRVHFFNEDLTFKRAFRTFNSDIQFRELIEVQLRKLLNRRISAERRLAAGDHQWHGSPFRDAHPFEPSDERVFTGREAELRELTERLQARAESGRALVLLSGPSGSGKTSLLRAGLIPRLQRPFRFEQIAAVRCCLVSPARAQDDPLAALSAALCAGTCLGDALHDFGLTPAALSSLLDNNPALAANQLGAALRGLTGNQMLEGQVRLLLIIDPLDALFARPEPSQTSDTNDPAIAEQRLQRFAQALATLAQSPDIWVLAAMRSDALRHLPRLPALAELLDASGWQRLEPLPSARIRQIVEIPARIAGIELEAQVSGPGRGLIELIEAEAGRLRQWAPPVQALLHSAYLKASAERHRDTALMLSVDHWRDQGGLAGQTLARANRLWQEHLDQATRAALPKLCRALIMLGNDGQAMSRSGDLAVLELDPDTRRLLAAMVEARLLTAEAECDPSLLATCEHPDYSLKAAFSALWRQSTGEWRGRMLRRVSRQAAALAESGVQAPTQPVEDSAKTIDWTHHLGVVSFAHSVLLSGWEPLRDWLRDANNRSLLHQREQLSRQARLWKRTSCNREYLFSAAGFAAVQPFAEQFPDELEPLEREFLQQTAAWLTFVRRRSRIVRAFGLLLIVLVFTASTAAWIAQRKSENARLALHQVQLKEADLNSRGGNTPQAVSKALTAGVDLPAAAVRILSDAFSRNRLIAMIVAPSPALDQPARPAANAAGDLIATLLPGQGARNWQLSDGRFIPADPPVLSDGRLGIHSLVIALDTHEVFGIARDGVYHLPAQTGDHPSYPCGTEPGATLALDSSRQRLALAVPGETGHQGVCVLDLGTPGLVLLEQPLAEQELRGLNFSPDGQRLLTASSLGRTHLFDLNAAPGDSPIRLSLPLDGPLRRPFNRAIFDPAGKRIGIAAADERVRLFDLDGTLVAELSSAEIDGHRVQIHNSAVRDLAFAPDGRSLVAVDDEGQVVRWSLSEPPQAVVLGHHELSIVSVAVAAPRMMDAAGQETASNEPDTLVLTASLDGTARLWRLATGKPLAVFGHDGALSGAHFAANSERVLSHSVRDGSLRLWSVNPISRLAFELRHPDPTNHIWHLDMAEAPPALRTLGEPGETEVGRIDAPSAGVTRTAPEAGSAGPLWLATAGFDGQVQLWQYNRDEKFPQLRHQFAPQELAAGNEAANPIRPVRRVQFSPSARRLAAARFDGSASLYDLLTGRHCRLEVAEAGRSGEPGRGDGRVFQVHFAPDERWLLTTSDDPMQPLRLFNPQSCEPLDDPPGFEQSSPTNDMATGAATESAVVRQVSAHTLVATGDDAGVVRLWQVDQSGSWQQQCALAGGVGAVSDLAIAPDGRTLAIVGEANALAILPLEAEGCGKPVLANGHSASLYSVAFAPDGERILTASLDKTARLWTRAGQPLAVLSGHQDRIYHAAFSPGDGRWLLTASRDGSLRIWQAPAVGSHSQSPGQPPPQLDDFLPLPANLGGAAFATFSPDGRYIAGAYWDNAALLWRLWREDDAHHSRLADQWGSDRARLALLKEAYRFRRDNRVGEAEGETTRATGVSDRQD